MASTRTGTVSPTPTQKRRVISMSSGFFSSTDRVVGSSAIPHFGHSPGSSRIRSEEHTSELQSLMRNSYAVFCMKKKNVTEHRRNRGTRTQVKSRSEREK